MAFCYFPVVVRPRLRDGKDSAFGVFIVQGFAGGSVQN